ncbi:MAG TPA: efflux RND transporter periplasmic adaptor subunit [Thermoanaerobaculia bacterium]|jgi:HlyD family secretion protein|nr:efflux RND transporter periplasmic adaptor subunit [Thermoanaerobaculia bacterium]
MAKKWLVAGTVVVLVGGGLVVAKATNKGKPQEQESPFRLGKTQTEDLQVSVREVGLVDPEIKVDVKSPVSGRVIGLETREGDIVARGQVLAEVEPDVNQAQSLSDVKAAVSQADLRLRDAERLFDNQKALYTAGLVANDQLRNAQMVRDLAADALANARARYSIVEQHGIPIAGGANSQKARVTTPMGGVVITKGVELGESVTSGVSSFNEGTVMFTVADLKSLLIKVNLNEVDIAKVRVGQPVRVTLDAYPQKIFKGKVRFVAPAAKVVDKIKVFEVEVALDELDPAFRTGMSANVEILGESRPHTLSIPLEALQRRDGKTVVYRLKANLPPKKVDKAREALNGRSKFVWLSENWKEYFDTVPVDAGIATLERVEVRAGLKAGDQVALEDVTRKKVEKDDENN